MIEYSTVVRLCSSALSVLATETDACMPPPSSADEMVAQGANFLLLRAARELDDAVLDIRLNEFDVAAIVFNWVGATDQVLAYDALLDTHKGFLRSREIRNFWKRVLKRVDLTSRSLVALFSPAPASQARSQSRCSPPTAPTC